MGKEVYTVTVYKTATDIMFISAFCQRTSEMFLIELPKNKANEVMNKFEGSVEDLVDHLDI